MPQGVGGQHLLRHLALKAIRVDKDTEELGGGVGT
jgi:hypothetical protein